jgi:CRISPR-associated protein Csm3
MATVEYKLEKKIIIKGKIKLLTGLHIGGTNSSMDIGGIDSSVVRNPIDNKPYIPGSSLKGKMRSLIEMADGTIGEKKMGQVLYTVTEASEAKAAKLFGTAKGDDKQRPSKLIVRDAQLTDDFDNDFESDLPYTEAKTEVTIDRITAKAMPRTLERIPAGALFGFNMVVNVFNEDSETELMETVFRGMKLLENDYLGGSGSRGYGQITFQNIETEVYSPAKGETGVYDASKWINDEKLR